MKSYNWDPETQFFGYTIGFSITADLPSSPWLQNNSQTANLQVTRWWRPPSHRFSVLYLLSLLYELKKNMRFSFSWRNQKKIWNFENRGAGARAQTQTKVSICYALTTIVSSLPILKGTANPKFECFVLLWWSHLVEITRRVVFDFGIDKMLQIWFWNWQNDADFEMPNCPSGFSWKFNCNKSYRI